MVQALVGATEHPLEEVTEWVMEVHMEEVHMGEVMDTVIINMAGKAIQITHYTQNKI